MKKRLIVRIVKNIPLSWRRVFLIFMVKIFYHLSLKHRLITMHNLLRSFPEKPVDEIRRIAWQSLRSFALITAEFAELFYLTKDNLHEWISIEGLENYEEACKENKGVLLFGAHFGCWELGNAALAITTKPFVFIYRVLDSPFLERHITGSRASYGNTSLPKEKAMRSMLRLLKDGATISLLIDQNIAWYEGIFVDFFGRPACTTTGLTLIALHTEAPVLPTFTRRLPNGKYLLEIGKRVEIIRSESHDNDILINTQKFTKIIEEHVRKYPEQYLWMHQRWKTKRCQAKYRG